MLQEKTQKSALVPLAPSPSRLLSARLRFQHPRPAEQEGLAITNMEEA
jgi:hypothetical protein